MDVIDQGCERAERDLGLALQVRKPEGPSATGICLFCGEPVGGGVRWCDAECRDDWERALRRAGL